MRAQCGWGIRMSPESWVWDWLNIYCDCSRLTLQLRCPAASRLADYFEAFNFESAVSFF